MQNLDAQALRDFIAKYAKPYDSETDTYDRPPFTADIKEGKNDPIYNAHSYHTKVPPRGIIPYILHYTEPGDVILDPFCGSGMIGVAALMCANPPADLLEQFPELKERVGVRYAILNDLSPAACHIAYNYTTPVDVEALRREFERIKAAVKDEFDWLYGTEHYEPAVGLYDPKNPEVAAHLKNPLVDRESLHGASTLWDTPSELTWKLVERAEVEHRLGFSVRKLTFKERPQDFDLTTIDQWIVIPATIHYTVWSDVYPCQGIVPIETPTGKVSTRGKNKGKPIVSKTQVGRGCGKTFTLWEAAVDLAAGEIAQRFECPHCHQLWEKRYLQKSGETPVLVTYEYEGFVTNARGQIVLKAIRLDRLPTNQEIRKLEELAVSPISEWHPTQILDMGREMMRHGMAKQRLCTIADFWTPRNRRAMAVIWACIAKSASDRLRRALQFVFTAIAFRVSRRRIVYCPPGGGWASTVISGTLYIPSLNAEANVWESFCERFQDILELAVNTPNTGVIHVQLGDTTNLGGIPDDNIDYIFADPPFGKNIYYADCSLLWEGWLDCFTEESREIVVNERRKGGHFKDLAEYGRLMTMAISEMFRILKPNRFATIEFNNSDGRVFEEIKRSILAAGFEIVNMLLLDKEGKTYKQMKGVINGENVVDKDVVFNLHKPALTVTVQTTEDHDLEQKVAAAIREHSQMLPERIEIDPAKYGDDHRTTATINSMLMNTLIPQGVSVERLNLPFIERVCSRYFRKVGQRWYLRGEAVGNQQGPGGLLEEEVAIKDEVSAIEWIRQRLRAGPALIGELKPLWMRAKGLLPAEVSQSLVLEDLLLDNFWRDADTNRWREPTDQERERMNDDRSLRVLHDTERFVAGTLSRKTTDAERCGWIDILFTACKAVEDNEEASLPALRNFDLREGYRLISQLFQSVLREKVAPAVYVRAEKQARVASQRLSKDLQAETDGPQARRRKDEQPSLFNWKSSK